jgi:hypothetical protein
MFDQRREQTAPNGRNSCSRLGGMKASKRLTVGFIAAIVVGCASTSTKSPVVTLPPFEDTYRWHSYHLTKETPVSSDGTFRLISVAANGDVDVLRTDDGSRIMVKKAATQHERIASKMPMRVDRSDYASQSADIAWLTTN